MLQKTWYVDGPLQSVRVEGPDVGSLAQIARQIAEDDGPETLVEALRKEGRTEKAIRRTLKALFTKPNWGSIYLDQEV